MPGMRRRDFVALLGGGAAAWPLTSLAQAPERMRRIGMLMPLAADDRETPARVAAFQQGLQQLGWTIVATCRLRTAGAQAIPTEYANT